MLRILFILFMSLYLYYAHNINEIELPTEKLKIAEANSHTFIEKYPNFVLPHQPLKIKFLDYNATDIKCHIYRNELPITSEYDGRNFNILVNNVTYLMGDIWQCDVYCDTEKKFVYFEVNIVDDKPPHIVLINNVVLSTRLEVGKYKAEYYYKEGDLIDVACISENSTCNLQMDFHNYKAFENDDIFQSDAGLGMSFKLKASHENSEIVCNCSRAGYYMTPLFVKFILQDTLEEIRLEINGMVAKETVKEEGIVKDIRYVNYVYFTNNPTLNITFHAVNNDTTLTVECKSCNITDQNDRQLVHLNVIPNEILKVLCLARTKSHEASYGSIEEIVITFTGVNFDGYNPVSYYFPKFIMMEKYKITRLQKKDEHIYSVTRLISYESKDSDISFRDNLLLIMNLNCILKTDHDSTLKWIVICIGIIVDVILITASIIVYYVKKHNILKAKLFIGQQSHNSNDASTATLNSVLPTELPDTDDSQPELIYSYAYVSTIQTSSELQYANPDDFGVVSNQRVLLMRPL